MKILMLGSDAKILDENSFARKRMEKYAEYLDKLYIVLAIKKSETNQKSKIINSKMQIYIAMGYFLRFFRTLFICGKILRNEKIDLITAQDIEHGSISFILSRFFGVPFEQQIHTDIGSIYFWKHSFKNKLRYLLAKILLFKSSCVRVVSKRIKNFLVQNLKINESKIAVIPIIPNISPGHSEPKNFPEFEKIILVVSRLNSEKNVSLAINAFAEVVKIYPRIGLIIVGGGPEEKNLKSQISNFKIEDKVRFEGFQNNLAPYYKAAGIFLLTSWYEGWAMSVVEAMFYGLPIVMTDVGCAGEAVKNGENGIVVKPGDKVEIINSLNGLLSDQELIQKISRNNQIAAEQFLNEENYYSKIISAWRACGE